MEQLICLHRTFPQLIQDHRETASGSSSALPTPDSFQSSPAFLASLGISLPALPWLQSPALLPVPEVTLSMCLPSVLLLRTNLSLCWNSLLLVTSLLLLCFGCAGWAQSSLVPVMIIFFKRANWIVLGQLKKTWSDSYFKNSCTIFYIFNTIWRSVYTKKNYFYRHAKCSLLWTWEHRGTCSHKITKHITGCP